MVRKNEVYEGFVKGLGTDGEGIIYLEGTTVFVPFCLIGETVRFKIVKQKGNIAYGKLVEVLTPSPDRAAPVCPVFGKCGGCDLQHASYPAQLEFKRNLVESALGKIGGLQVEVNPVQACAEQYGYRNKISLPIGVDGDGNTVAGFYARRSHRIVPVKTCAIQADWVKAVISALENFIVQSGLKGYDEERRTGDLRHLVVREIKGKFIFALVATRNIKVQSFISELENRFEKFTLLLNINAQPANVIFGEEWRICRGEGFFSAEDNGIKYKAGANTFLQVNDGVRAKLYSAILNEVDENAVVIDAYSGGGMLTAMLAKNCKKAYGVEIVEEASRCADELKVLNGLEDKMVNICGRVEDKIQGVISAAEGSKKIIVCDPPRKGMERAVVKAIARAGADKIILVSCNPATLARDLGLLLGTLEERDGALVKRSAPESEYEIKYVTPFDMFPQTKHVETLVILKRI